MQGPTLRKPAHLQLSTAASGGRHLETGAFLQYTWQLQCGHGVVHWPESTIVASLGMSFVEAVSVGDGAGG
jgi:hypothetical protein